MSFELFEKSKHSRRGDRKPRISILKSGSLNINRPCLEKHLHGVEAVQLLFDADLQQIAIKPAAPDDGNTFKITQHTKGAASIAARLFLNHYGIDWTKTKRYEAQWDDSIPVIIITLG